MAATARLVNEPLVRLLCEGGATRGDPSRCVVLSAAAGEEAEQRENHDDDDDPDDDAEDAPPLARTFLPSCFDAVTHSGSRCLARSSSGSRRSTGGVNALSSKAIPLSGGLVIRNRRSRSWSSRRCQLLAVAPRSLVLGTACFRSQTTPGFRGRVLVGWLYLSSTVPTRRCASDTRRRVAG